MLLENISSFSHFECDIEYKTGSIAIIFVVSAKKELGIFTLPVPIFV
jgi:hypothetical protein